MTFKLGGFGYKIDYDKEIAEDEALIALWDGALAKTIAAELSAEEVSWRSQGFLRNAFELLTASPERRAHWAHVFGLNDRTLALVLEIGESEDSLLSSAVGLTEERRALKEGECSLIAKMRGEGVELAVWHRAAKEYLAVNGAALAAEYVKARAEVARLEAIEVTSEKERVARLKHAKTSLARHKRNQSKWSR